ncbi:FACR273Wp [Eremothecium gossypii FDAG1]|nr:FACR273Wp [Eremothecium gossypii FDAG1]
MKFLSTVFLGAAALANMALADSEQFYLLCIKSASQFHYSSIHPVNGQLKVIGKPDGLSAVVTDDRKLKFSDGTYAVVTQKGPVVEGSKDNASTGFFVADGHLKYADLSFMPAPNGDSFDLAVTPSTDSRVVLAIRATNNSGGVIPDFPAHN